VVSKSALVAEGERSAGAESKARLEDGPLRRQRGHGCRDVLGRNGTVATAGAQRLNLLPSEMGLQLPLVEGSGGTRASWHTSGRRTSKVLWKEKSSLSRNAPQKRLHRSRSLRRLGMLLSVLSAGCCLQLSWYSNQTLPSRGKTKAQSLHGNPVPPGTAAGGSPLRHRPALGQPGLSGGRN